MSIKKMLFMVVVVLMGLGVSLAQAEGETSKSLGVEINSEVMSGYDFYGYDLFGDKTIWRVGATFDLPALPLVGEGLFIGVSSLGPLGDGFEKQTRVDYTAGYRFVLLKDTPLRMDTEVAYSFLDFVKSDNNNDDIHRIALTTSFPEIITILGEPLVPSIQIIKLHQSDDERLEGEDEMFARAAGLNTQGDVLDGVIFIGGLDYSLPEIFNQQIDLSAKAIVNDGLGESDSGLSHFVLGISTDLEINKTIMLTPYVNYSIYQTRRFETANSYSGDDSFSGGVSLKIKL